jgi:serine/threonine-protein kinase
MQTIVGFEYLETHGILHRDIREANIMVDSEGAVKIIDFGFGKMLSPDSPVGNSILLNWDVTHIPEEIAKNHSYTHQTEMYFLGKLFQSISQAKVPSPVGFKYEDVRRPQILTCDFGLRALDMRTNPPCPIGDGSGEPW